MSKEKTYIAIDLKSFYASVECMERGLDPLTTHLVGKDHMSGGISFPQGIWTSRQMPAV